MLGTTRKLQAYGYAAPTDLRKGFEGLFGLVSKELGRDPLSGDLFLFVNRGRNRSKVLFWDGTGLCIYQKRLERGRFACLWERRSEDAVRLTVSELALFLEGCQLASRVPLSPERFLPATLAQQCEM